MKSLISKKFRKHLAEIDAREWRFNGVVGDFLKLYMGKRVWVDTTKLMKKELK